MKISTALKATILHISTLLAVVGCTPTVDVGTFAATATAIPAVDIITRAGITTIDGSTFIPLVNSTDGITSSRYDTYEHPRGSDYQVSGQFHLVRIIGTPRTTGNTPVDVHIGYGDTAVSNSAVAPTNAVTLLDLSYSSGTDLNDVIVWLPIPDGKYPWIQVTSGQLWNVQALGYEK